MPTYGFHPEALLEYAEAAQYYLREAPPEWQRPSSLPLNRPLKASLRLRLNGGSSRSRAFVGMSSTVFPSFSIITGKQNKGALPCRPSCIAAANQATGDTESPNLAHALAAARGRCLRCRAHWRRASDAQRWALRCKPRTLRS